MPNIFEQIQINTPKTNTFDLSHDVKMSCNMGKLYPVMCLDCLPGDKIRIGAESLVRFAPLVSPVMHRMDVFIHYFFVPNRLVWDHWEQFITQTPIAGSIPAFPTIDITNGNWGELEDYLGLPQPTASYTASAIPHAAYQKIWNDFYRDQNLQPDVPGAYTLLDGNNGGVPELLQMRTRSWEHDYFTSCLPFPQKGQAVSLPIGTMNDVPVFMNDPNNIGAQMANLLQPGQTVDVADGVPGSLIGANHMFADTSQLIANPTTINDLRRSYALQRFFEKQALGGSRYSEQLLVQFGVKSSDARLQRPEYITGVKTPVVISEVLNTSDTANAPQGNMAGHGIAVVSGGGDSYFCEEHGYIIGIMSMLPKTAYQQGLPRHFSKITDATEFYFPDFAHIGEQEVKNKELYIDHTDPEGTFGYQSRYAEYKFQNNRVAGTFKTTLSHWHLGRIFSSDPNLNAAFIEANPRTDIFAVPSAIDTLYCHVLNKVTAQRRIPKFSTPF